MTTAAFLGLDIGGTGAKAGVFDETGRPLGFGRVKYAPDAGEAGRAEIPIEHIYEAARQASRQAIRSGDARVVALSIASMGQTFVALDELDQPLHPAILWYDSRAGAEALELAAAARQPMIPESPERTLVLDAIASASKILWLRRWHADRLARARRYLLMPDYFAYRLTGEAVTDPNTASSTGFAAGGDAGYDAKALAAAGVAESSLARILPSGAPIGCVLPDMAEKWGLAEGALLVAGTNDQYAGALGAGNCRPGILSETTGTCLALVTLAERLPSPMPPGLLGGQYPIPGYQFALAYAKTAGLVLDWFHRQFRPEQSLAELEALAAESPPGSRGLIVLPHFDGMVSPQPNSNARGAVLNLALSHTLADVYRAMLESIAFSLRENIELLSHSGFALEVIRSIGGGAASSLWLQIKADVTGMPVEKPAVTEAATLGAAMLAAVGCGAYASLAESSAALYHAERTYEPDAGRRALYEPPYQNYRELYARLYEVN